MANTRMNIVYMHAHDAGRYVQPYGFPVQTPNLLAFAREGVLFRQAFAAAPTCGPSRSALLGGQYPHELGMFGLPGGSAAWSFDDYDKHLVPALAAAGYETVLAGVQHETGASDKQLREDLGYQRLLNEGRPKKGEFYPESIDHVGQYLAESKEKPFFLSIGIDEPHRNNLGREELGIGAEGERFSKTRYYEPDALDSRYVAPPPFLPDLPDIRRETASFHEGVRLMDEYMGRVLYALKHYGYEDNTLVIITTDHGIEFPGGKMTLTDQGIGVMLMIRGPYGFRGGRVLDGLVSQLDIYPTLCELLGWERKDWLRGTSLMPLIRGETDRIHAEIFAEQTEHCGVLEPLRCVRTERYKLVARHSAVGPTLRHFGRSDAVAEAFGFYDRPLGHTELFDLYLDPWEHCNRAEDESYSGIRQELEGKLRLWMEKTGDPFISGQFPTAAVAGASAAMQPVDAAALQHAAIGEASSVPGAGREVDFVPNHHPATRWFDTAALGLFIHWGISAVDGEVDLSWGMMAGKPWETAIGEERSITPESYFQLAGQFQPPPDCIDGWLSAAAEAGFRYAVLTTRHHDGFALWPSEAGEFNTRLALDGRDLVAEFVAGCRRHHLKVGLYYSPPDWYYNREYMSFHYGSAAGSGAQSMAGRAHYGQRHEPIGLPTKPDGWQQQFLAYVRAQLLELLTGYGQIDVLWFDGGKEMREAISIEEIRRLQPGILINARMHGVGDFATPECRLPSERPADRWEHCNIWAEGPWWGYIRSSERYRPTSWLLSTLSQVRAWGGNFLVNIGPRADGTLPEDVPVRLAELREWMRHSGIAVYDVTAGPYPEQSNVPVTCGPMTWYFHVPPEADGRIVLTRPPSAPVRATLLRTGERLEMVYKDDVLTIAIPDSQRTPLVDVVAVEWRMN